MISHLANPQKFLRFAKVASPLCSVVALVLIAVGVLIGLFFSPADYQQGDTVRLMYIHVPAATMALSGFVFIAMASLVSFVWRHNLADIAARAAAAPGALFTFLALFTGAVWGKPTWGAWWVWDARLTSVLILFFIYLGYIAVWRSNPDERRVAGFARLVALVGAINVPIVKFSVDWWNSLHQPASLLRSGGPTIHPDMLLPLLLMMFGYGVLFAWLVLIDMETQILRKRARANRSRGVRVGRVTESYADDSKNSGVSYV